MKHTEFYFMLQNISFFIAVGIIAIVFIAYIIDEITYNIKHRRYFKKKKDIKEINK